MATRIAAPDSAAAVLAGLRGKRLEVRSVLFQIALLAALVVSLGFLVILLVDVFRGGTTVLSERGIEFIRAELSSLPIRAGVWQGIVGSLLLMAFVAVIAFPLGIGAAVYLEEYATDNRLSRFINVNIRNLAGVPSIVYGLLGLAIFVKFLGSVTGGRSLMSAGITLAILALPIVIITSMEALRAVPTSIREAGYGVGATKWEVIRSHVLPSAAPGILTGTVLSLSRAMGETAPLILVGAVTGYLSFGSQSVGDMLQDRFTALPMIIYTWARLPNEGFRALTSAAIVILLIVILLANGLAIYMRNRYERKW